MREMYGYPAAVYAAALKEWGSKTRIFELPEGRVDRPNTLRGRFIQLIRAHNLDVILKSSTVRGRARIYCSVDVMPKLYELLEQACIELDNYPEPWNMDTCKTPLLWLYKYAPSKYKEAVRSLYKHYVSIGQLGELRKIITPEVIELVRTSQSEVMDLFFETMKSNVLQAIALLRLSS